MSKQPKWSDLTSGDASRTLAAASQLLPFWVSLVLVIAIGWQLARLVWLFVPAPAAGDAISVPAVAAGDTAEATGGANAAAIAAASIFGKADPGDAVAEPAVLVEGPDLEETRINLTLKGTIASDQEAQAAAIIEVGASDEAVFTIGDSVSNGASLHAIYTDRVVLNESGRLTALYLPEERDSATTPRRTRSTPVRRAPVRTQTPSIQSVVSQNVARLSDVIRPTPYFVNGQQKGFRVYPGRDRQKFAALGLRAGDLILDINGQALSDPSQAMQVFQSLGDAQQVSVTVERNGQPETITLNTEQLDLAEEGEDQD